MSPSITNRVLIKTVGCELEFALAERDKMLHRLDALGCARSWRLVHDGSCSESAFSYPNGGPPLELDHRATADLWGLRETTRGGELVSPELNTTSPDWFSSVEQVLAILAEKEEGQISPKSSVHVHVNIGNGVVFPMRYFHNFLKIANFVEDALFRLSCGENKTHRGITNNFQYCRPNSSPPCTHVYGSEALICPSFDMDLLAKTQRPEDIHKALGRLDLYTTKYVPARYVGINFVSMFTLGSIEFRTFNASFVPSYVKTWIELSRHLVELALNDLTVRFDELEPHPLGEGKLQLDEFNKRMFIPHSLIPTLEELWELGEPIIKPIPPAFTHLTNQSMIDWYGAEEWRPKEVPSDSIIAPAISPRDMRRMHNRYVTDIEVEPPRPEAVRWNYDYNDDEDSY
jgi:hypothetical protein